MDSDFLIDEEELPLGQKAVPPPSVAWSLIQKFSHEKDAWKQDRQKALRERREILCRFAIEYFEISRCLKKCNPNLRKAGLLKEIEGLNIVKGRILDILDKEHIKIEDLAGKVLTEDLQEKVKVLQNVKSSSVKEWTVKETLEPIVYHENEVIHTGKVIALIPEKEE